MSKDVHRPVAGHPARRIYDAITSAESQAPALAIYAAAAADPTLDIDNAETLASATNYAKQQHAAYVSRIAHYLTRFNTTTKEPT